MPRAEAFEKGRLAAQRALKLDPHQRDAHQVLSNICVTYDWNWSAAEREFKLQVASMPSSVGMESSLLLSLTLGRWDDVLKVLNVGLAVDPLNPEAYFFLGIVQLRRGRLLETEAALHRTIELSPTFIFAHYDLALVRLGRKEPAAALAELSNEPSDLARLAGSGLVYFTLGRKAESDAALAQLIKDYATYSPSSVAAFYAFRGEADEAFKWLERAYAQKDPLLIGIKYRTEFDKLHDDPRYKAFLKKMILPE